MTLDPDYTHTRAALANASRRAKHGDPLDIIDAVRAREDFYHAKARQTLRRLASEVGETVVIDAAKELATI